MQLEFDKRHWEWDALGVCSLALRCVGALCAWAHMRVGAGAMACTRTRDPGHMRHAPNFRHVLKHPHTHTCTHKRMHAHTQVHGSRSGPEAHSGAGLGGAGGHAAAGWCLGSLAASGWCFCVLVRIVDGAHGRWCAQARPPPAWRWPWTLARAQVATAGILGHRGGSEPWAVQLTGLSRPAAFSRRNKRTSRRHQVSNGGCRCGSVRGTCVRTGGRAACTHLPNLQAATLAAPRSSLPSPAG